MAQELDKTLNLLSGFKHPPINPKTQIRLLRISPPLAGGPRTHPHQLATYTLVTARLTDLPRLRYRALSYVWGLAATTSDIREIEISGRGFAVRRNAYDFLHTVAARQEYGLFFVDAVCVDQLDCAERTEQVKVMARVFRDADVVVAWLGDPGREEGQGEQGGKVRMLSKVVGKGGRCISSCCADWTREMWEGFRYLSYHRYWQRVWIVQEILLAARMEVWCGFFVFPLSMFGGPQQIDDSGVPMTARFGADGVPDCARNATAKCRSPAAWILAHRLRLVVEPGRDSLAQGTEVGSLEEMTARLKKPSTKALAYQSRVPDLLHVIIFKFGQSGCSDVRDRLYGLLGLLSDNSRTRVEVSYEKPVWFAFYQALRLGLEEIHCESEGRRMFRYGLPYHFGATSLAYYCQVRNQFGLADKDTMPVLRRVVGEIRSAIWIPSVVPYIEPWHQLQTDNEERMFDEPEQKKLFRKFRAWLDP